MQTCTGEESRERLLQGGPGGGRLLNHAKRCGSSVIASLEREVRKAAFTVLADIRGSSQTGTNLWMGLEERNSLLFQLLCEVANMMVRMHR